MTLDPAIYIGAGAAYPASLSLKRRFMSIDRFDEPYSMWTERDGRLLIPRQAATIGPRTEDRRTDGGERPNFNSSFIARTPDQENAVAKSVHLLSQGRDHLLCAPTGVGKTVMGLEIAARINRPTLVLVHKEDLYDSWLIDAKKILGLSANQVGRIQADVCEVRGLTLGMIQSLAKQDRYPQWVYEHFGLVIVDECHRLGAEVFSQSMWNLPARMRLGLSATPTRKDGRTKVLTGHIGPVLVTINKNKQVPKIISMRTPWKPPHVKRNGQWVPFPYKPGRTMNANKSMAECMPRNELIAEIVEAAFQKGRKTIVFSALKAHLAIIEQMLLTKHAMNDKIGVYIGGLSRSQREAVTSKPIILATYKMGDEGTNIPDMDTCVLATPMADVVQPVGRILREHAGKKQPVVIDLVDSEHDLFMGYYRARSKWYRSIGAEVVVAGG